jgi:hypothetical protein
VTTVSRWQEWMIDRSRGFSLAQLPEARAPVASVNDERPSSRGPRLTRQVAPSPIPSTGTARCMRKLIDPVSAQAAQVFCGNIMNTSLSKLALIWTVPVLLLIVLVTSFA